MATLERLVGDSPRLAIVVALFLTCSYIVQQIYSIGNDTTPILPWVGKDTTELFANIRSSIAAFTHIQQWLAEGYVKYSKQGLSYNMPSFFAKSETIVPHSGVKWLLDHPDDEISIHELLAEQLGIGGYAFTDSRVLEDPFHLSVMYKNLPRRVGFSTPEISAETTLTVDDIWGMDKCWHEINTYSEMTSMVTRISNLIIVGPTLCRKQGYLDAVDHFLHTVVPCVNIILRIPLILRPVIGPMVSAPGRYFHRKIARFCTPLIEERIRNIAKNRNDPSYNWKAPNDYLTWHITQAYNENRMLELDCGLITRRLLLINFAAIHTTTVLITETLINLYSSDPSYLEGIREEVTRIYKEDNGVWTREGLAKMFRTDSALRESLRLSDIMTRGLARKVISKNGVKNEIEGYALPYGTYVSVDIYNIHHDPSYYKDPEKYDAFRFSRPREEYENKKRNNPEKASSDFLEMKGLGMVTTGGNYYGFGHGRHTCPARFFVAIELKIMLAHIVMNYDVEPLPERPLHKWLGAQVIPHITVKMKIKRKETTGG